MENRNLTAEKKKLKRKAVRPRLENTEKFSNTYVHTQTHPTKRKNDKGGNWRERQRKEEDQNRKFKIQ